MSEFSVKLYMNGEEVKMCTVESMKCSIGPKMRVEVPTFNQPAVRACMWSTRVQRKKNWSFWTITKPTKRQLRQFKRRVRKVEK